MGKGWNQAADVSDLPVGADKGLQSGPHGTVIDRYAQTCAPMCLLRAG